MKNTSGKKKGNVGGIMKGSVDRFVHDPFYRSILYVCLILVLLYLGITCALDGIEAATVKNNTELFNNDPHRVEVLGIDEDGTVSTENITLGSETYERCWLLYGNGFWLSVGAENVLGNPMGFNRSLYWVGMYMIKASLIWAFAMFLIKLLYMGGVQKNQYVWQKRLVWVLYAVVWGIDFISGMQVSELFVNVSHMYIISGFLISLCGLFRAIMFKLYTERLESKK